MRSEGREQTCLHYAEPRGGKDPEGGLIHNSQLTIHNFSDNHYKKQRKKNLNKDIKRNGFTMWNRRSAQCG